MNEPSNATPQDDLPTAEPAGFWRRLGALFVDAVIIGCIGLMLLFAARDMLAQLGSWGRLVGFLIAMVYFGTLNSRFGDGQTLGKRMLGIKVVDRTGAGLSLGRSFLRSSVLQIPWSLNGAVVGSSATAWFWFLPLSIAVFGAGLSIVYLFIFNRAYRQSLHDLVVGSFVVRSGENDSVGDVKPWKPHLMVCALLFLGAGLLPVFMRDLAKTEPFRPMLEVQQRIAAEPDVINATLNWDFPTGDKKAPSYLVVEAHIRNARIDDEARAKELAQLALDANPSIRSMETLQVTMTYGFDIGIASSWIHHHHRFDPKTLSSSP